MNRRLFFEKAMILGLGALTLLIGSKGIITEASAAEQTFSGQDVILLPPFEKNNPLTLERAFILSAGPQAVYRPVAGGRRLRRSSPQRPFGRH